MLTMKQIGDLGVAKDNLVFAITEGGETSFVIGTAWEALDRGADVAFVYNNPDEVLREHVRRSQEVLDEPRVRRVNLTTGPMAITGSTRMQATSIELLAMMTVLEMTLRDLLARGNVERIVVEEDFLARLEEGPISIYDGFDPTGTIAVTYSGNVVFVGPTSDGSPHWLIAEPEVSTSEKGRTTTSALFR